MGLEEEERILRSDREREEGLLVAEMKGRKNEKRVREEIERKEREYEGI